MFFRMFRIARMLVKKVFRVARKASHETKEVVSNVTRIVAQKTEHLLNSIGLESLVKGVKPKIRKFRDFIVRHAKKIETYSVHVMAIMIASAWYSGINIFELLKNLIVKIDFPELIKNRPALVLVLLLGIPVVISMFSFAVVSIKIYIIIMMLLSAIPYIIPLLV